uniref:Uncharacterized protein n=1 Tax=Lactuca sativa TaxID=4236 RepID=A0A9R1W7F5_LACSA|nr:hypothetical protein LSAT_V11C300138120 [Lactuca sativa]
MLRQFSNRPVVITKKSKSKSSGDYVSKIILVCNRGGVYKATNTSRINVTLTVKKGEHNHEPAMHIEGHVFAKWVNEDERHMVEDMIDNDVPPCNILSTLKSQKEHM